MNRAEFVNAVKRNNSTTLIAQRMRETLNLPAVSNGGRTRDKSAKSRKYRGARKLMKQKHGVRL